jgi:TRAP transporter TAXI family solute receptor
LIEDNSFYRTATIPGEMYRGNDSDTSTFGVGATLVTSAAVSDDAVYALVSGVFDNLDAFKALHPAFANLSAEEMISDGLSAPLHAGAERYYREQGWLQ